MKEDNSNTLPRVNFLDHFIGRNYDYVEISIKGFKQHG